MTAAAQWSAVLKRVPSVLTNFSQTFSKTHLCIQYKININLCVTLVVYMTNCVLTVYIDIKKKKKNKYGCLNEKIGNSDLTFGKQLNGTYRYIHSVTIGFLLSLVTCIGETTFWKLLKNRTSLCY